MHTEDHAARLAGQRGLGRHAQHAGTQQLQHAAHHAQPAPQAVGRRGGFIDRLLQQHGRQLHGRQHDGDAFLVLVHFSSVLVEVAGAAATAGTGNARAVRI
jgi:hypothetical protein